MKFCIFILVVGIGMFGYSLSLPPMTIETIETNMKAELGMGGLLVVFLAMAGIMGGGK